MRLVDLHPSWYGSGERQGVGISFECPGLCGESHLRCAIPLTNPLDGGPQLGSLGWTRTGDTFETLTLRPSIQRLEGCKWHGLITDGNVVTC